MIHCDDFRAKLPKAAIVKCLADASFFLDEYAFYTTLILRNQVLRLSSKNIYETILWCCGASVSVLLCCTAIYGIKSFCFAYCFLCH